MTPPRTAWVFAVRHLDGRGQIVTELFKTQASAARRRRRLEELGHDCSTWATAAQWQPL